MRRLFAHGNISSGYCKCVPDISTSSKGWLMAPAHFDFAAMQAQGAEAAISGLYVLVMTPLPLTSDTTAGTAPGEATPLEIHYAYMHGLIEQGKILLIGPCMGEPIAEGRAPVPPGIGILRVATRGEAEEIAANEPFHAMGWRHNAVMAWTPKFGTLIPTLGTMLAAEG